MAIYTGSSKHLGGTDTVINKNTVFYGLVQKNVLVTGADGQLGQELRHLSNKINIPFRLIYTDAPQLDITDIEAIRYFVKENSIEYIINCAAYTAVDKAEEDEIVAYRINFEGAKNLAIVSSEFDAKLIHISTDYVFDGTSKTPYKEEDTNNPLSVYGKSKLKGEQAINEYANDWIIIRTSWMFSRYTSNFVKTMLRLMTERDELSIVGDQRGTPTYATDLAEMIFIILDEPEWHSGIYHFSNSDQTTWYDFAIKIQEMANLSNCRLHKVSTDEYKTAAQRPLYSVFDKSKIENKYNVVIPSWEDALQRMLETSISEILNH